MNYKAALVFTFLFLGVSHWSLAQKENNNWYFGNKAGLTFNNGSPVALDSCAINSFEASISVSDSAGNLLFYSDGVTVWNRNHVPMQNGNSLMGSESATQSALAVPLPGLKGIYYIFTVDATENSLINGLRYSILDMNLDGGLGGITNTKNVLLEVPVTEKLTAIRHGNNKDYWVLAHKWNSNEFLAYELTSAGLSKTAVISKVGSIHSGLKYDNALGQMKANRKGAKIALAIYDASKFEVFDFNRFTGAISNVKTTSIPFFYAYGVEFSEDGTKLYGTVSSPNQSINNLFQFNLADPAGLKAITTLYSGANRLYAMQLGPDKKIYVCNALSNYLGVINEPNSIGTASKFNSNEVKLNLRFSQLGLPNMIITAQEPTEADFSLFVPNIITPNNDDLNDAFVLKNLNSNVFELQIFNRWGSLIYKTESYNNDWDAQENAAGMYYYLLRNSENGAIYKGWLEVVK